MPVDPSKIVSQEFHDGQMAKLLEESPDVVIVRDAPIADMRRAEALLSAEEGKLADIVLRFPKGHEVCPNCGRQFNVLDMIIAALEVHDSEFVREHMFGDDIVSVSGYNGATGDEKAPVCADCGQRGAGGFYYGGGGYHWIK